MVKIMILVSSVLLSMAVAFATLCLSPRDPTVSSAGRGTVRVASAAPTGWAKTSTVVRMFMRGRSHTFGGEQVLETLARRAPRTVVVNLPGILLGWAAGFLLGGLIGGRLERASGRAMLASVVLVVIVPAPVWVLFGRMAWLDTGLFRTGDFAPAILTVGWMTAAPIAIYQAVLVGAARRRPEVVFATALGLPLRVVWHRLILPHTRSFWLSELSLLFVSACEGSVLVERVYAIDGLGAAAFEGCTRSDPCLVITLVGITSTLVNIGVTWTTRTVKS